MKAQKKIFIQLLQRLSVIQKSLIKFQGHESVLVLKNSFFPFFIQRFKSFAQFILLLIFGTYGNIYAQSYCASSANNLNNEDILNVTVGTLNNSSTCSQTGGPGSMSYRYSDYTSLIAAPVFAQLNTVPFSIQIGGCNGFDKTSTSIWIDYNHNNNFDSPEERVFNSLAYNYIPLSFETGSFIVPTSALTGPTRMRVITNRNGGLPMVSACGTYNYGETEDYTVNIATPIPCIGVPSPGITLANQNPVCSGRNIILSLSFPLSDYANGYTYQWYNNAGAILGATDPTYTATIITEDNFHCVVTCNNGLQSSQSTPVAISLSPFYNCYCASAPDGNTYSDIYNVTVGTLNNSSNSSQTGGPGSLLNRYSDFTTLVAAPVLNILAAIPLSIQISPSAFYSPSSIWIDFNHNRIFEAPDELVFQTTNLVFGEYTAVGSFTVPITAQTGITRMRVITNYGNAPLNLACGSYINGETEDYLVNIEPQLACSGSPAPRLTVATQNPVCPEVSFTFSLDPIIVSTNGYIYQWFNNSGHIAGATNETYTATITTADNFYCNLTCPNGGATTSSTPVAISAPYLYCSCVSTSNISDGEEIFNVTVGTLHNSSNCTQTGGPGSVLNKYSDYTTLGTKSNFQHLNTIPFSIEIGNCINYALSATSIWIDYNHNGSFDAPIERVFNSNAYNSLSVNTITGAFIIPASALLGLTRMRVITTRNGGLPMLSACGIYEGGETEDYFVNITSLPCSGVPSAGITVASQNTICPNTNFTLSLSSPPESTEGVTFQWFNNAGAIAGATEPTYSTTITSADNFHCKVTCTISAQSTTSTPIAIGLQAANTLASQKTVCTGTSVSLSLSILPIANEATYQWFNNDGAILGATEPTYLASITKADNFYCNVTCSINLQTTQSTPVAIDLIPFFNCYCSNGANTNEYSDIYNVTVGTLNNTTNSSQTGGPGSILNKYSDFTTLAAAPVFEKLNNIPISVQISPSNYFSPTTIWIDYDHNGVFDFPNERVFQTTNLIFGAYTAVGSFVVPLIALTGITRMRVITNYGSNPANFACGIYNYGETEDYLVNIMPPPACSGTPDPLVTIATKNPANPALNFTFSLNPLIITSGNTFQWYNNEGPIVGATNDTFTTTITKADNFHCDITCPNGGETTSSTPVAILEPYVYSTCFSGSNISGAENILNVTVGTLNNNSNCNRSYSDFTTLVMAPNLLQLDITPFSITMGTCGGFGITSASIWIDYNHNGNFDAPGERVYNSGTYTVPSFTTTGTFKVPSSALTGLTRMRVIVARNASIPLETACGMYDAGETEDYFVNITLPACNGNVTLPAVATINIQNVAEEHLIANNCQYVAKVVPSTGFTDVTVKSWLELTPPFKYVPRHFEITPNTNPNSASGTVTLFYSQADFDSYNETVTIGLLPTGLIDAQGIANFQILKYAGTSPTGLGYSSSPTLIPGAGNSWNTGAYTFFWNPTNSIWEVTFPVSGFSGFLAKSTAQPLPVNLISFNGKATEKGNELSWKTSLETNFSHFEIEKSVDTKKFEKVGKVTGANAESYVYLDEPNTTNNKPQPISSQQLNYYRLKMMDLDGKYNFSKIISIENIDGKALVGNFYPNPTSGKVFIEINAVEKGTWNITIYNLLGKVISNKGKLLQKGLNKIALENLNQGINFVRFENGIVSEIRKILKD